MRLKPDEPGRRRPDVRPIAQPALVLDRRVANHERVDANADLREVVSAFHLHCVDACGCVGAVQQGAGVLQRKWDSQLARQDIRRAERDDSQPRPAADQAVGHCRDRTIASGGHHGVKSLRDRPPDDRENVFSRARLVNPVLPASLRLVSFPGLADLSGRRVP